MAAMSTLFRRLRRSEEPSGLAAAMEVAQRARDITLDGMSDEDLEGLLDSAVDAFSEQPTNKQIARAIGVVDIAVRRRLGVWRAALQDSSALTGQVKQVRRSADGLLRRDRGADRSERSGDPGQIETIRSGPSEAARMLSEVISRLKTEHPTEVRLSPEFYQTLEAVDDTGCLSFVPTRQQLAAAALLLRGVIVEMDAGEGKTLASAIAAIVFAAAGHKVHILTANDYLAFRDCEALAPLFESLGLTVGLVIEGMDRDERRLQYAAQVVFATAREVGFDYLRDNVARSLEHRVNQEFDVAIVDEADHLLIDQARTPLIISGEPLTESFLGTDCEAIAIDLIDRQTRHVDALFLEIESDHGSRSERLATVLLAAGLVPRLTSKLDELGVSVRQLSLDLARMNDDDDGRRLEQGLFFAIDEIRSEVRLTERGWQEVFDRLYSPLAAFEVLQMLRARVIHDSDVDYVIGEDGITLVDRLDGRPMRSHRYMHGLHEALESKEGLDGLRRGEARARTTIQALMSNYEVVSGLSGTAVEGEDDLFRNYGTAAVRIPPESDSLRVDLGAEVFFDRRNHLDSVVREVTDCHRLGRPVLVTTGSVGESAALSTALTERGICHELLNAANPESESLIVSSAGEFGAITVSTGMAGRGTDIIVESDVDAEILSQTALLARRTLDRAKQVIFECASPQEASALCRVLDGIEGAQIELRDLATGCEVVLTGPPAGVTGIERAQFGLGLAVIIASLPGAARVERQIRGRTGRQGGFGTSRLSVYINDRTLAYSRQERELLRRKREGDGSVSGAEVVRLLRQVQAEAQSQLASVSQTMSGFEAIVEGESRTHYAARLDLLDARQSPEMVEQMVADWVARRTADLDDGQTDYETRFGLVSDGLWHHHRIDIGDPSTMTPATVRRELTEEVGRRLNVHRDRLGAKRFALAVADACLNAADDLWPGRLAAMQDMTVTAALGASSRRAALTELADHVFSSRVHFWADVEDSALRMLLSDGHVADAGRMRDNHIEELPDELAALVR